MRFGIVGYGPGGRLYHAPFIEAAGLTVAGVVTRSKERRAQVRAELPGTAVAGSLTELLQWGMDAVVITTPPHTHREPVLEALYAGVPTVADKPFAPNAVGALELVRASEATGVPLAVYQNRRWDGDVQTVRALMQQGALGELTRLYSVFDLDEAWSLEAGPDGGVLRDLGSHVIDQALMLLGPAARVTAWLDTATVKGRSVDCAFEVAIEHVSGVTSHLSASKVYQLQRREWRVYGSAGSFILLNEDVQAQAVLAGGRPLSSPQSWGHDREENWGTLRDASGSRRIPTIAGNYTEFYRLFAAAVQAGTPVPVTPRSALETVRVLDAARRSAVEHRSIEVVG